MQARTTPPIWVLKTVLALLCWGAQNGSFWAAVPTARPLTLMSFAASRARSRPAGAARSCCHEDQKGLIAFRRSGP